MHDKMNAIIKGHDCQGKEFESNLEFKIIRPKDDEPHYGTGCYMTVEHLSSDDPAPTEYVDVRYEKTTNIRILAERWIKNYYGKNAEEVCVRKGILDD